MSSNSMSPPMSTQQQYPNWNPEQQRMFQQLYSSVMRQAGSGEVPTSPNMFVPRTEEDTQYFDWVNSLAGSRAAAGKPLYDVGPEWAENYYEQSIKPGYMKEWEDVARPGIQRAYAGPGFYSSARMEQEAEGSQDLAMELASRKAGLIYGEEKERRSALDKAFGHQMQAGQAMGQAGQYARAIEQERVMSDLQKFLMGERVETSPGVYSQQPLNSQAMQQIMQLLGLSPHSYGTETTGAGLGYQILPSLIGAVGAAASDRRLKKNIVYL